jgi:hypothetical protein
MKKRTIVLLIGMLFLLLISCMGFMINNLNALMVPAIGTQVAGTPPESAPTILEKLQSAPWQGLRYLEDEKTWRFYGVAGESRQIDLIYPMTLIKVYYLGGHEQVLHTWVTNTITFPNQHIKNRVTGELTEGELVAVQVSGAYVSSGGVDWQACDEDFCRVAERIDTLLVLDDQGTGISNGFIRYGWAPPSYPSYGFLCWELRAVSPDTDFSSFAYSAAD